MSSQAFRIFGSVFLIAGLIGFATIFGNWESSVSTKTSPQFTKIENKSYSNIVSSTQAYFSKYLVKNQYMPVVPDDLNSEWLNAHIMGGRDAQNPTDGTGSNQLESEADPVEYPLYACTPDGSFCKWIHDEGYRKL